MSWNSNLVGRAIYYQLNNLCSGRVYPNVIAQDATFPCIAYSTVSTTPDHTKDSKSVADKLRIQVDIFDKTYDGANVIASLVRDQLDFVVGTVAGIPVDTIRFDGEQLLYENEIRIHHIAQDYIVRIPNDSAPSSVVSIVTELSKSADFTATNAIPPGYMLNTIVFDNPGIYQAQLSGGTAPAGNDIFRSEVIAPGRLTTVVVNNVYSLNSFTSIYFNHAGVDGGLDTWGGATLTIYLLLTKIK